MFQTNKPMSPLSPFDPFSAFVAEHGGPNLKNSKTFTIIEKISHLKRNLHRDQ